MSEDRFRIVGPRDQYEQVYFVRQDADGQCLFAREEDRRYAAKLTATLAIEWCKHLRSKAWPQCRVISMDGSTMFAEETALAPPQGDDPRRPMYDDVTGVRVVPGTANTWWVRFPNSPYESIKGSTPEETLQKYNEHPQHLELSRWVERYVPPAEEPVDPRELQRQFEREQMNGRRLRIGDSR